MKPKFNISEYTHHKFVMICTTDTQLKQFCAYLNKRGRRWSSGVSYSDWQPPHYAANWGQLKVLGLHFNIGKFGQFGWDGSYARPMNDERFLYYDDFEWDNDTQVSPSNTDVNELFGLLNTTQEG